MESYTPYTSNANKAAQNKIRFRPFPRVRSPPNFHRDSQIIRRTREKINAPQNRTAAEKKIIVPPGTEANAIPYGSHLPTVICTVSAFQKIACRPNTNNYRNLPCGRTDLLYKHLHPQLVWHRDNMYE